MFNFRIAILLILFSPPIFGRVVLVSHAASPASGGTNSCATASTSTAGANFIVVGLGFNGAATHTIADSFSNSWVPGLATSADVNAGASQMYWCFKCTTGAAHTITVSGTSVLCAITMQAFSGVKSFSTPFEGQNGSTNGVSTTATPGSLTPNNIGDLLVTTLQDSAVGGTASINTGFTITDQVAFNGSSNFPCALAYLVATAATPTNPTWTFTSSVSTAAMTSFAAGCNVSIALLGAGCK